MALKSTNIANTLLQTLQRITSQGDNLLITKETVKPIQTMITVCTILLDSAETVAESTGDPEMRERTFLYSNKIKSEIRCLEEIKRGIDMNPSDPSLKSRLLNSARAIASATSQMLTAGDDLRLRKIIEASKECANFCKNLIASTNKSYEEFFEACKNFGGATLELAKLIQEVARKVEDNQHQQKILNSYTGIKEIGPQLIRAAKHAYDNPNDIEAQHQLQQLARTLSGKISYAISVAQPDGGKIQNELGVSAPVIPIPTVEQIHATNDPNSRGRRRTIKEPSQGNEILTRATTATIAGEINDVIESASMLNVKNAERKVSTSSSGSRAPSSNNTNNNNSPHKNWQQASYNSNQPRKASMAQPPAMNPESRGLVQRIQSSLMSGMKKSDTLPAAKKAPEHAPVKQSSGSASPRPMKRRAESAAPSVAFTSTSSASSTPSTPSTTSTASTASTSPTQPRASTVSAYNSAPSPIAIQSEKDTRTSEALLNSVEKALSSYSQHNTSEVESPSNQTQQPSSPSTSAESRTEEDDDELTTSIIIGLEEEYKKTEELSASQSTNEWKSKYEELLKNFEELKSQFSLVQQENELLKVENENLGKVVDSLKKRLALNAK